MVPIHLTLRPAALRRGLVIALVVATSLSGCVVAPQRREMRAPEEAPPPAPPTEVYFYPTAGQDAAQQDRDRYECHLWAVRQTGYDPGQPRLAPHQRVVVEPRPAAGASTAAGAVTGAVLGAVVSPPRNAMGGAVLGAVAGAMIGAAADSARQNDADRVQRGYDRADQQRYADLERRAADYRRAISACLEGRGYKVE